VIAVQAGFVDQLRSRNGDDRTRGVRKALVAHRADQQPAQSYVFPRANDQEVSTFGLLSQHWARIAGEAPHGPAGLGLHGREKLADVLRRLQSTRLFASRGDVTRERHRLLLRSDIGMDGVEIGTDRTRVSGRPAQRLRGRC
jgi:hypothetical protein